MVIIARAGLRSVGEFNNQRQGLIVSMAAF
jgi:hypothetical protein